MWNWKYVAVFAAMSAFGASAAEPEPEGGGQCAMSAALGHSLPTSCSVVWISPTDKLYCFSNERAKEMFMRDPEGNEQRAQAFWKDPAILQKLLKDKPEG